MTPGSEVASQTGIQLSDAGNLYICSKSGLGDGRFLAVSVDAAMPESYNPAPIGMPGLLIGRLPGYLFQGTPVRGFLLCQVAKFAVCCWEWATGPFFVCTEKMKGNPKLTEMVRNVVEPMGYELVGCELVPQGKSGSIFRVYIDHEQGITLDDCSTVSHQLSGVLDVEDPIRGNYNLEISSPGLDRPLFEAEHFDRFAGNRVAVKMQLAVLGRKNFKGLLLSREGDDIQVEVDGEVYDLPINQIDQARLIPDF